MSPALLVKVIAVLLFMAPGLLSLVAAVLGCHWFIDSRSASPIRNYFGVMGTRIFYGIVGLLLITAGFVMLTDPMGVLSKS